VTDQEVYEQSLANGCSPKLAEMFALATPPQARTDSTFLSGNCNGSQFEHVPGRGDYLKEIAEARGQSVTGKVYKAGLARYPGDPEAWVSGRGDVERVARARGWGVEGDVSVPAEGVERIPARKTGKGKLAKKLHEAGLPIGE
jgi:hypothetical protein